MGRGSRVVQRCPCRGGRRDGEEAPGVRAKPSWGQRCRACCCCCGGDGGSVRIEAMPSGQAVPGPRLGGEGGTAVSGEGASWGRDGGRSIRASAELEPQRRA